jgi:hypothetical protein
MKNIPKLSAGGLLTPAQWDRVASIIDANFKEVTLQQGIGYSVTSTGGGTTLNIRSGNLVKAGTLPWDQVVISQTSGTITFKFMPASVGGVMPDNIFTEYTAPMTGTKWYWVEATTTGGSVSSCTINSGTTQPTPTTGTADSPPSSFKVLVSVSVEGVYFNLLKKNLSAVPVESYRTSRTGVGPFELPYTSYWNWIFA